MNNEAQVAELIALRNRLSQHSVGMTWIGSEEYVKLVGDLELCIQRMGDSEAATPEQGKRNNAEVVNRVVNFCDKIEDFWRQGA